MGQTLTHGVYLPDEGERNCYSGLASNWSILDGAVGTIAEHTTALAGKAPAVHTHVKADITDFPAYGSSAGTICEGNDARLSDARTPTSHIHGSITNDGKLGTASMAVVTDANKNISVSSVTATELGYLSGVTSAIQTQISGKAPAVHTHTKSDVTDLFNSANTWSANNTYSADCIIYNSDNSGSVAGLKLRNSKAEVLSTGNTSSDQTLTFRDKNDYALAYIKGAVQSNGSVLKIGTNAKDSSNNVVNSELQIISLTDGNKAVFPSGNNSYDLGRSSYQWNNVYSKRVNTQTLNGINPGALSIPDGADSGANSSFTPDTTDWPKDGTAFQAIMPIVGWLRITIKNVTGNYAFVKRGTAGANQPWQIFADPSFAADLAELTLNVPVTNATYTLKINSPGGFTAKVYSCLGNV